MAVFITNEGGILSVEDVVTKDARKVLAVVTMPPGSIEKLARQELAAMSLDDKIVINRGRRATEFVFFKFLQTSGEGPFDYTPYYIERGDER